MNRILHPTALTILLFYFSCSGSDEGKFVIKYGMKKYERTSEKCDSFRCAKISLEYPEIKSAFSETVRDSLRNHIQNTLLDNYSHESRCASLGEMAKLFFADYASVQSEPENYSLGWEINNNISIIFNRYSIVSFQSEFYHFTDGAHGMSGTYFSNLNSQDESKINLKDLFKSGFENELNKIAEKIFRKERELSPGENLEEAGFWFEKNKFSLNENFGIKDDGLAFFFNAYEVAPYAMGPTEILVPYAELKSLINEGGLLQKILSEKEKYN